MYSFADSTTTPEIINFFESSKSKAPKISKLLLGNLYQMKGKYELAEKENDKIIADNPNTSLAVVAALSNMRIELYSKNNVTAAQEILNQVKKQSSLIDPMVLTDAETDFTTYVDPKSGQIPNSKMAQSENQVTADTSVSNQSSLMANYPNPFNPTTVINYQIARNGYVTLKVYDILGREVATLVNEYEATGSYSVTFNASNLASGVYIYQLRSGNFLATKKLLLMK